MSKIKETIEAVQPPPSIWKPELTKDYYGITHIKFTHLNATPIGLGDDQLGHLIGKKLSVGYKLNTKKFHIDVTNTYHNVRRNMKETMECVYEENSAKLHPFKTKVGKWLTQSDFMMSEETEDIVFNLWKYILDNRTDETHMKNAFKIIEVLHVKYRGEYPTPESRQVRRRRGRW